MKYLVISLSLFCACSTSEHKENFLLHIKNDWKEDQLRGKAKHVIENEYETGNGRASSLVNTMKRAALPGKMESGSVKW